MRNRGVKDTDEDGMYDYSGGLAWARLQGPLVSTNDDCGGSLEFTFRDGDLNFGASGGTDCATPAGSRGGNTHASRTSFYHLRRIKQTALGFLPDNP